MPDAGNQRLAKIDTPQGFARARVEQHNGAIRTADAHRGAMGMHEQRQVDTADVDMPGFLD